MKSQRSNMSFTLFVIVFTSLFASSGVLGDADELARASKIVGPENADDDCASCHTLEHEAWQATRHYASFKDRHRTSEAKEILANMELRSMKRSTVCRQCHYTSRVKENKVRPAWGVSCESCHAPAGDWNDIHNRQGGNQAAEKLKWGDGKTESSENRVARLGAARDKGMIHSEMLYEIAANCFSCHTVPNEALVNRGGHHVGKEFDLVARSQGEVRHNFASSAKAPDSPTNRPAMPTQLRRLFVVGALVDLEFSLRNLANVKETKGEYHKAMIKRANAARDKVNLILNAVRVPELAGVVKEVPKSIDASTSISADLADNLSTRTREFVKKYDGTKLDALDNQIPTKVGGEVYQP